MKHKYKAIHGRSRLHNGTPAQPSAVGSRIRNFWIGDLDEGSLVAGDTVFEDDGPDWEFTGVLDADGEPVYRLVRERVPMGFHHKYDSYYDYEDSLYDE